MTDDPRSATRVYTIDTRDFPSFDLMMAFAWYEELWREHARVVTEFINAEIARRTEGGWTFRDAAAEMEDG